MVKRMNIKRVIIFNIGMIGLFALSLVLPVNPASAQNGTWLAVSPEESSVPLGNQAVIELVVTAGANINAYDLTLSYDPAIILLTDWEHGDYLSSLAVVMEENTPGTFRLAATQLAQPEVFGDGVLLRLTFDTRVEGDSLVEIVEAVFADSHGGSVSPELLDGWVYVTLEPTFTPTLTATPTLTPTPEISKEATTVNTPTATTTSTVTEMDSTPEPGSVLPGDGEETGEGTSVTQTEDSYPVASDSEGQDLTGNMQGDGYPYEVGGQNAIASASDADPDPGTQGNESLAEQQEAKLNRALWGVVMASAVALGLMAVIIIRRKNRKNEDLLL